MLNFLYRFLTVQDVTYLDEDEIPKTSNQLKCDICDRKFGSISERNQHIEDHFLSIQCPNCSRSFTGDRAFKYHISNSKCKGIDFNRFRCNICNEKVFDSVVALNIHLHTEHKCSISDEQIDCNLCNRTFARLKYLRKHIREVHENATPFDCKTCGKQFNRKANLIEHELIHKGKYLAKCKTCKQSYRTSSALKLHERTHTGEKPYACDICNEKAYAYNTDLKRHKRSVHGILGTPYPCTICSKIFYEPKLLRNHTARAHRTNTDSE